MVDVNVLDLAAAAVPEDTPPPPLPQYVADPPEEFRPSVPRWGYIAEMRSKLKALSKPIWGDKNILWTRLRQAEYEEKQKLDLDEFMRARRARITEKGEPVAPLTLPVPRAPTEEERTLHELTHQPPERWCEFCVSGHGTEQSHFRATEIAAARGPPLLFVLEV